MDDEVRRESSLYIKGIELEVRLKRYRVRMQLRSSEMVAGVMLECLFVAGVVGNLKAAL
ncbi:MAG TPA: hypothetical protein VGB10_01390 [Bacteroidota bacterium]